jgi:hypothetical protein
LGRTLIHRDIISRVLLHHDNHSICHTALHRGIVRFCCLGIEIFVRLLKQRKRRRKEVCKWRDLFNISWSNISYATLWSMQIYIKIHALKWCRKFIDILTTHERSEKIIEKIIWANRKQRKVYERVPIYENVPQKKKHFSSVGIKWLFNSRLIL